MNGQGQCEYCNGFFESGTFDKDELNGQGRRNFTDGAYYVGEFKKGVRTGYGRYVESDGDVYVGEFLDNKYHGQGKLTYASGNVHNGGFKNGETNGHGVLSWKNGTEWSGHFSIVQEIYLSIDGQFKSVNGTVYVGTFLSVLSPYEGYENFTDRNGVSYYGLWSISGPEGIHNRTTKDGTLDQVRPFIDDSGRVGWVNV